MESKFDCKFLEPKSIESNGSNFVDDWDFRSMELSTIFMGEVDASHETGLKWVSFFGHLKSSKAKNIWIELYRHLKSIQILIMEIKSY